MAGGSTIVPADENITDREARLNLARLFTWENRLDEAEKLYADQLSIDPDDQKIRLERRYKWHLRHGRALESLKDIRQLLQLEPSNPEARFDRSQLLCFFEHHEAERMDYNYLLNENPHHVQVIECKAASDRRIRPRINTRYMLWDEEGRDRLIGMQKQRTDLSVDHLSPSGRAWARIGGGRWRFSPDEGPSDDADGLFADTRFVLSPAVTIQANASKRDFSNPSTPDSGETGAMVSIRLPQAVRLQLSHTRQDEIVNQFSLTDALQVKSKKANLIMKAGRRFEVNLSYASLSWNDDNEGTSADFTLAYDLRPHPLLTRLIYRLSLRDTDEESQRIFTGDTLVDIIHPYWTPQDWREHALTYEIRKDLVPWKIRGAGTHEIGMAFTAATDNESNDSIRFEGWWLKDLRNDWSISLRTIFHASDYWDAHGATISVGRRF
jgi:tetratricopeptide (TPR) repeat protein